MNTLHPIVLLAYNRPQHTEQVLVALQNNELANKSTLYVYIDGLKANATEEDRARHDAVIAIVNKEQWCAEVKVHVSDSNRGCRLGPIYSISQVLSKYDAAIILEDDIITSPLFLQYMNAALNYYRNYKTVFSISGYNLPPHKLPIPEDYNYDVYVSLRQQNWGWGTWRDRWTQVDWDKNFIPRFLLNRIQVEAFNRGGNDLSKMLAEEFNGDSDAWDIQFSFFHFKYRGVSIIPCHSFTNNIGLDSSGTHTIDKKSGDYENNLSLCNKEFVFLDTLYDDKRILNAFYSAYYPHKRPLWKKMINYMSRMIGFDNVFVVKRKIYV